jgi:hypothetical protein
MKFRIFCSLMMEAARTSETSVDIDLTTRQYIPYECELHEAGVLVNRPWRSLCTCMYVCMYVCMCVVCFTYTTHACVSTYMYFNVHSFHVHMCVRDNLIHSYHHHQ